MRVGKKLYFCTVKRAIFIILLIFGLQQVVAQSGPYSDRTTIGRDFWVMFLCNSGDQEPQQTVLTAIGDSNAVITVANLSTGWSSTVNMVANQAVQISVPIVNSVTNQSNSSQTKNYGLHVTSTTSISLLANNDRYMCNDATLVYPAHALGTHYIMQDYPGDPWHPDVTGAEVGFVATMDSTVLTIVTPCTMLNSSVGAGGTFTVNLMRGESYQLITTGQNSFSGMEVTSNGKPFAAFQGNKVAYIPIGSTGADLLYEQAVPTDYWGTDYVVVASSGRIGDQVRITSAEDSCKVFSDGTLVHTLQKGETYEDNLPFGTAKRYVCSKKVCVGRYLRSSSSGGNPGDPASVIVPPANQGFKHVRFISVAASGALHYYLNVVAKNSYVSGVTLDGNNISNSFVQHDSVYSYAIIPVYGTVHLLDSPLGPVVAAYYELGSFAGLAYLAGRSFVDSIPEEPLPQIHRDTTYLFDTICQGDSYTENGFSIVSNLTQTPGVSYFTDSTVVDDTIVHYRELALTILAVARSEMSLEFALGDTVILFGDTFTCAGTYIYHFTAANGCDSMVTVYLNYEEIRISSSADGVCPGDSVTLTAEGLTSFQWYSQPYDSSLDAQQGQNTIVVYPTVTTVYSLLDPNGIVVDSFIVHVETPPSLCIEYNRDFIDFDHPILTLHNCTEGRYNSTWTFSDGYTVRAERVRRQFHPPLPDTITVTLRACTQYGCCTDTTIGFGPEIRSVWFPNIFTPDEQQNNRFGCITSCQVAEYEINVFNRWGLFIWQSTDILTTWDGTRNGVPVPQGAYVYKWYLKDIHGDQWRGIGTVTLVR